jgi:hypothetical protein
MTYELEVAVLGCLAVIVFDLVASFASRHFGFAYARASIGSYVIYLAIGFFAARGAVANAVAVAAATAAVAGLVDASLGWAISWRIGPGRLPEGTSLTIRRWITTAAIVISLAAGLGAVAAILGGASVSRVAEG